MISRFLIIVIVVTTIALFEITSAIDGGKEAGRVVLKNFRKVVHPTTEFPYSAMVEHKKEFICGAVIITVRTVLTAAHCVKGVPARQFIVRAGTFTKLDAAGKYVQTRKVDRKFTPPNYNPNQDDFDIAVLKLITNWIFNPYVRPALLPNFVKGEPYVNKQFVALGHGRNEYGEISQTLKRGIFKVISKNHCLRLDNAVPKNMLCATEWNGLSGVHYGDSGSPLIADHNPERPQDDVVIGIVAYVFDEQEQKGYSAYTNVMNFVDWIKSKL